MIVCLQVLAVCLYIHTGQTAPVEVEQIPSRCYQMVTGIIVMDLSYFEFGEGGLKECLRKCDVQVGCIDINYQTDTGACKVFAPLGFHVPSGTRPPRIRLYTRNVSVYAWRVPCEAELPHTITFEYVIGSLTPQVNLESSIESTEDVILVDWDYGDKPGRCYKVTDNHFLRSTIDMLITDVSLDECKRRCDVATSYSCNSLVHTGTSATTLCILSSNTHLTDPDNYSTQYGYKYAVVAECREE